MTSHKTRIGNSCLVCNSKKNYYNFSLQDFRVEECKDCGLMCLNPQPTDRELAKIYTEHYFVGSDDESKLSITSALKSKTADDYLDLLAAYQHAPLKGSLLEIGSGLGDFLARAVARSLQVTGVEYSSHATEIAAKKIGSTGRVITGEITQLLDSEEQFDYIVFSDVLEHVRNPRVFLQTVHSLLRKDGIILVAVPSLDSFSARLMKNKWMEFKPEHLWYFSTITLKELLYSENFSQIKTTPAKKTLSVDYIAEHFELYPAQPFTKAIQLFKKMLPECLQRYPFRVVASGIVALARKTENRPIKKLSIIMAAYNEESTIKTTVDRVLAKKIPGIDIELIIVESRSTDKTAEIIRPYEKDGRVKIIWQEAPRGKGNAIREGFKHMTGDIVLIQDSDDEYDLEDYDVLIAPIMTGEAAFVLGARHGGRAWKMRQFNDQFWAGHILNFGHWFFTTLVNIFFNLRLKDPFTMYKVFRTDCLTGLTFECDRFDFDFELLIKLVRNGYKPIEIPVNYRSRSFKEGKKVRVFQDPITWIKAIIKFRCQKI